MQWHISIILYLCIKQNKKDNAMKIKYRTNKHESPGRDAKQASMEPLQVDHMLCIVMTFTVSPRTNVQALIFENALVSTLARRGHINVIAWSHWEGRNKDISLKKNHARSAGIEPGTHAWLARQSGALSKRHVPFSVFIFILQQQHYKASGIHYIIT